MHEQLLTLLKKLSVRWGYFTLASGKQSDFYVDVRQTSLHPRGAWLLGNLLLERLRDDVVAVGGLTMGADPIATAVATVSHHRQRPIFAFLIRKEAKGHGVERFVVGMGNLQAGNRVAIVEDTTTTGQSLLRAVERAEEAGLEVVQCLTVVDREDGAAKTIADAGYTLETITTRTELER
ncbi:MAG: orotate phosphoribosyltransferase [Proteobacteria bacterium]|jgi:orotate phosphoribosyltransferase|nr:orotate phosphoribosyltransferase [Pseudomonadota bacterium]